MKKLLVSIIFIAVAASSFWLSADAVSAKSNNYCLYYENPVSSGITGPSTECFDADTLAHVKSLPSTGTACHAAPGGQASWVNDNLMGFYLNPFSSGCIQIPNFTVDGVKMGFEGVSATLDENSLIIKDAKEKMESGVYGSVIQYLVDVFDLVKLSQNDTCCVPKSKTSGDSCVGTLVNLGGYYDLVATNKIAPGETTKTWTSPGGVETAWLETGNVFYCKGENPNTLTRWHKEGVYNTGGTGGFVGAESNYLIYPDSCGDNGAKYLPPWNYDKPETTYHNSLYILCESPVSPTLKQYCGCSNDGEKCQSLAYSDLEVCKENVNKNRPDMMACYNLDKTKSTYSCEKSYLDGKVWEAEPLDKLEIPGTPFPDVGVLNQLKGSSLQKQIGRLINFSLGIIGMLALAMIIMGGFLVMVSAGNAERTKQGVMIMVWSTIAVLTMFASYGIVKFIFSIFL